MCQDLTDRLMTFLSYSLVSEANQLFTVVVPFIESYELGSSFEVRQTRAGWFTFSQDVNLILRL